MASTIDNSASFSYDGFAGGKLFVFDHYLDFTDTDLQLAQNETMSLTLFPVGTIILAAQIKVETADTDVIDVDLGYTTNGATGAQLIDGVTLATTGYKFTAGIAAALPITTASYLVLTNKDASTIDEAKIRVIVIGVKP